MCTIFNIAPICFACSVIKISTLNNLLILFGSQANKCYNFNECVFATIEQRHLAIERLIRICWGPQILMNLLIFQNISVITFCASNFDQKKIVKSTLSNELPL